VQDGGAEQADAADEARALNLEEATTNTPSSSSRASLRIPEHRDHRFRPNVIADSGDSDQGFRDSDR
jgi:hypothetical protein